jgi:hypothetical protein
MALRITASSEDSKKRAEQIVREIEAIRNRRLYCFYQDMRPSIEEDISYKCVAEVRKHLAEVGHVEKLSIFVESPGGNPDQGYRLVRTFRRYADDIEAIVVSWAKSGATFLCLSANSIAMSYDGELGPLDTQIRDPRGGRSISALNAFKSLEFLREHVLEALETLLRYYVEEHGMSLTHAVRAAEPLVSDIVTPLFQQVDPLELGEARRYLNIVEQYSRIAMERYSYPQIHQEYRENMVRKLVWDYPSHGFVIDRDEARKVGLNVVDLDDKTTKLCEELLEITDGCIGILPAESKQKDEIDKQEAKTTEKLEEKKKPTPHEEEIRI